MIDISLRYLLLDLSDNHTVQYNTNNYRHTDLSAVADGDICTITSVH